MVQRVDVDRVFSQEYKRDQRWLNGFIVGFAAALVIIGVGAGTFLRTFMNTASAPAVALAVMAIIVTAVVLAMLIATRRRRGEEDVLDSDRYKAPFAEWLWSVPPEPKRNDPFYLIRSLSLRPEYKRGPYVSHYRRLRTTSIFTDLVREMSIHEDIAVAAVHLNYDDYDDWTMVLLTTDARLCILDYNGWRWYDARQVEPPCPGGPFSLQLHDGTPLLPGNGSLYPEVEQGRLIALIEAIQGRPRLHHPPVPVPGPGTVYHRPGA